MNIPYNINDKVKHERFGLGTIIKVEEYYYKINFGVKGVVDISKTSDVLIPIEDKTTAIEISELPKEFSAIEKALFNVLEKTSGLSYPVAIGKKWSGGKLILQPGNLSLQPKEIPIEQLFRKIILIRDRLRVLEQNINSHEKLSQEDKVDLQQYITRAYGSLTTFNILFQENKDHFVGEKK